MLAYFIGLSNPVSKAGPIRAFVPVHPDHKSLTNEVSLWYKAPETTVVTVVAIVTDQEIVPVRHLPGPGRECGRSCRIDENIMLSLA